MNLALVCLILIILIIIINPFLTDSILTRDYNCIKIDISDSIYYKTTIGFELLLLICADLYLIMLVERFK